MGYLWLGIRKKINMAVKNSSKKSTWNINIFVKLSLYINKKYNNPSLTYSYTGSPTLNTRVARQLFSTNSQDDEQPAILPSPNDTANKASSVI